MTERYSIFMVVATLLLTFAACDKDNMPGFGFTTGSIFTLTLEKEPNAAAISVGIQNYNPVGIRRSGDTPSIANRADGSDGVRTVRVSTGELFYSLAGWTYDGKTEKFDNQVMNVAINNDYIFVANHSSRIDMFHQNNYAYVTTIGRIDWQSSSLLQYESAEVAGDKLFICDKQKIKVIQLSDCTLENHSKAPVSTQNIDSITSNNGFNPETVARYKELICVSDYESPCIPVIDPSTVTTKGEPVRFVRSYRMQSRLLNMGFFQDEMHVVRASDRIVRINLLIGEEKDTYSSFAGGTGLGIPGHLLPHNDVFYLSGRNMNAPRLIQGEVISVEISELG